MNHDYNIPSAKDARKLAKELGYNTPIGKQAVMNYQEIIARLEAEGISTKQFVRGLQRPEWLGHIKIVERQHKEKTKTDWENETIIYHLPEHGIYLRVHRVKEKVDRQDKKKWRYWSGLQQVNPQTANITSWS